MSTQPIVVRTVEVKVTLKPRQVEILRLIVAGNSNKEIASILVVSKTRVKQLIGGIFALLGVDNRTAAAIWAVRKGIC